MTRTIFPVLIFSFYVSAKVMANVTPSLFLEEESHGGISANQGSV